MRIPAPSVVEDVEVSEGKLSSGSDDNVTMFPYIVTLPPLVQSPVVLAPFVSADLATDGQHALVSTGMDELGLYAIDNNIPLEVANVHEIDKAVESGSTSKPGVSLLHTWSLGTNERIQSALISKDGSIIACGSQEGYLTIWSVINPEEKLRFPAANPTSAIRCMAWHPGQLTLAVGLESGIISLWSLTLRNEKNEKNEKEKETATHLLEATAIRILRGGKAPLTDMCWRMDGSMLYSAATDGCCRCWQSLTWKCKLTLMHGVPVTSLGMWIGEHKNKNKENEKEMLLLGDTAGVCSLYVLPSQGGSISLRPWCQFPVPGGEGGIRWCAPLPSGVGERTTAAFLAVTNSGLVTLVHHLPDLEHPAAVGGGGGQSDCWVVRQQWQGDGSMGRGSILNLPPQVLIPGAHASLTLGRLVFRSSRTGEGEMSPSFSFPPLPLNRPPPLSQPLGQPFHPTNPSLPKHVTEKETAAKADTKALLPGSLSSLPQALTPKDALGADAVITAAAATATATSGSGSGSVQALRGGVEESGEQESSISFALAQLSGWLGSWAGCPVEVGLSSPLSACGRSPLAIRGICRLLGTAECLPALYLHPLLWADSTSELRSVLQHIVLHFLEEEEEYESLKESGESLIKVVVPHANDFTVPSQLQLRMPPLLWEEPDLFLATFSAHAVCCVLLQDILDEYAADLCHAAVEEEIRGMSNIFEVIVMGAWHAFIGDVYRLTLTVSDPLLQLSASESATEIEQEQKNVHARRSAMLVATALYLCAVEEPDFVIHQVFSRMQTMSFVGEGGTRVDTGSGVCSVAMTDFLDKPEGERSLKHLLLLAGLGSHPDRNMGLYILEAGCFQQEVVDRGEVDILSTMVSMEHYFPAVAPGEDAVLSMIEPLLQPGEYVVKAYLGLVKINKKGKRQERFVVFTQHSYFTGEAGKSKNLHRHSLAHVVSVDIYEINIGELAVTIWLDETPGNIVEDSQLEKEVIATLEKEELVKVSRDKLDGFRKQLCAKWGSPIWDVLEDVSQEVSPYRRPKAGDVMRQHPATASLYSNTFVRGPDTPKNVGNCCLEEISWLAYGLWMAGLKEPQVAYALRPFYTVKDKQALSAMRHDNSTPVMDMRSALTSKRS